MASVADMIAWLAANVGRRIPIKRTFRLLWLLPVTYTAWWLWIDDEGDHWVIWSASDRNTHNPRCGEAYSVDFDKATGELRRDDYWPGVCQSALSMWPVHNRKKAAVVHRWTVEEIEEAYRWHKGKVA